MPGGFVGVDIFFVISGFLITGILLREARQSSRISLLSFYARRAKRILPAALIVLAVTTLLTITILPRSRWDDFGIQLLGSVFSVVNWVFAGTATDYLRSSDAPSPLQHYWTLSVEEQFYLVWPLLLVVAIVLARKRRSHRRQFVSEGRLQKYALAAALLITIPSLAYSVFYTTANPGAAYFVTTTRMWELGIGCLLAVTATTLPRMGPLASNLIGVGGIAAMLAAAVFFSAGTQFPGYAALLPTLGAAAVIVGGMHHDTAASRILSLKPMQFIGDISYSLYLWHWPLIVIGTFLLGGLALHEGIAIVLLSLIPAYLSFRFVETPALRTPRLAGNLRTLGLGALAMCMVGSAAIAVMVVARPPVDTTAYASGLSAEGDQASTPPAGAELLAIDPAVGMPVDQTTFRPDALAAPKDNPALYEDGCHLGVEETTPRSCAYGDEDAQYTVALVGDSHAAHWAPALTQLATEKGFRLETDTKSSCPLVDSPLNLTDGSQYEECAAWNSNVTEQLLDERPDLVVVSTAEYDPADGSSLSDGLTRAWEPILAAGIPLVAIADIPIPGINVPECVEINPTQMTNCAVPREEALNNARQDQERAVQATGASWIDLTDMICPTEQCAPVIGNVLVFRDKSHLTATYSMSLASALGAQLATLGVPPTAVADDK